MNIEEKNIMILDKLNEQQKEIVVSTNNLLVKACPGSGKTRTLTSKIIYTKIQHPGSIQKIIAITYTNRAAEEIKDRIEKFEINQENIWVGTIHQFCLEYIIRPYLMYDERIKKGFTIIDEFVKHQYLEDIVKKLHYEKYKIYIDSIETRLDKNMNVVEDCYPEVVKCYHEVLRKNKEIDFDLILSLSYKLLHSHNFIVENISKLICSLFIDEYQDTNNLQYIMLGLLTRCNSNITTLVVGDTDQAIYGNLGGIAKEKNELQIDFGIEFVEKTLDGCYRSTQRIIDYYSKFQLLSNRINSKYQFPNKQGCIYSNSSINKNELSSEIALIIKNEIESGIKEKDICVLAPQWSLLYSVSKELKSLLPNIKFDAPDISPIKYEEMNVLYKISVLAFTEAGKKILKRKRIACEIIDSLCHEYGASSKGNVDEYYLLKVINEVKIINDDGVVYFIMVVNKVFSVMNIDLGLFPVLNKIYYDYIAKIEDRITRFNLEREIDSFKKYYQTKEGVVITTCHKIKGEEYHTVIAIGLLYGMIPHWSNIYEDKEKANQEAKKLLYVIASRAKEKLYLFSESGRMTTKGIEYKETNVLADYMYQYDS